MKMIATTLGALILAALIVLILALSDANAARRHVRIYKQSPPVASTQPAAVPLIAVPPIAVAFDLVRRTSCDPAIAVSTGPGDPGFDPAGPKTGNFLLPAIYRSECAQPRRR